MKRTCFRCKRRLPFGKPPGPDHSNAPVDEVRKWYAEHPFVIQCMGCKAFFCGTPCGCRCPP